ncbi:MAG: hypothetical protein IPF55_10925 [Rhodoferax sp.]|nr:hypothetical protein [Rhodoferax sp.]
MHAITPTKTKLASLALAIFIALTLQAMIVWKFEQVASAASQMAATTHSPHDASSFEI